MMLKKHIAFLLSSAAMLALLLHGIIPHHHHNSETEMCRLDISHSEACSCHSQTEEESLHVASFCTAPQSDGHSHAHVCNFNSEKIKNVKVALVAVIKVITFYSGDENPRIVHAKYNQRITVSPPPESYLLRAPPLV